MMDSRYPPKTVARFRFVEAVGRPGTGGAHGETVLLLHGMIGGTGNWDATISELEAAGHRVLAPCMPVFEMPRSEASVAALARYAVDFLDELGIGRVVAGGNSLGGHVATMLSLEYPARVRALLLTGSSGIDEIDMGATAIRRTDRAYLRERAETTFFDSGLVTESMLDEIVDLIADRASALSVIQLARSVKKEAIAHRLCEIDVPTLVVWGRDDVVTPPYVAGMFARGIAGSELHWLDRCGHAPMMEHPAIFNRLFLDFLARLQSTSGESRRWVRNFVPADRETGMT